MAKAKAKAKAKEAPKAKAPPTFAEEALAILDGLTTSTASDARTVYVAEAAQVEELRRLIGKMIG
tara:strand:- start:227 stop:421 length:195 start_codon:yes stop_codon:yes gene_type:complete